MYADAPPMRLQLTSPFRCERAGVLSDTNNTHGLGIAINNVHAQLQPPDYA